MKLLLTINSGTLASRVFELETGFLTIGRGETCSVRFDPAAERIASKQHAFIEAKADGYYLTDNESTNGTMHNGDRIQKTKLNSGDTVQFGKNGVMATVTIQQAGARQFPAPAQFREEQIQQFNQIAQHQTDNFQNSMSSIGLGSMPAMVVTPEVETGKGKTYALAGITLIVVAILSLVVIFLITASLSPGDEGAAFVPNLEGVVFAFVASFVAFIPAMFYVLPLIWLDRYDPEPMWLLALAFAWGALVAVIASFIINTFIGVVVTIGVSPEAGQIVGAVISAPVFEEASKGIGLLILLFFFRRYFDDILDGIVFAGVIALGFATVENVLYYGRAFGGAGVGGLAILFFVRGILSPFAHVTFTAMTGIGCGIARESHSTVVRVVAPVIGYFAAVFLHALWNGMAVLFGLEGFLLGYLFLEIPFFFIFVGFSFYIMWRQNKILKEMLAIDIARGLIPKDHGDTAVSAFKSSGWLIAGLFSGKFRPRSRYLRAIGKLGLSYWHIQRATAAQGQTGSFQQNPILREEVLKWRDKV
ncbi:MAG: PrsW family glutamic-type intramembrane protease [Pyrinomonadaceae bacterium]